MKLNQLWTLAGEVMTTLGQVDDQEHRPFGCGMERHRVDATEPATSEAVPSRPLVCWQPHNGKVDFRMFVDTNLAAGERLLVRHAWLGLG